MILHCKTKSMKEMLKLLANQGSSLHLVYPNFAVLSRICLTLPISTADCEDLFHNAQNQVAFEEPNEQ